jgi:hypothetical protein
MLLSFMKDSLLDNLNRLKIFVIYFALICGAAYVSSLGNNKEEIKPLYENIYFFEKIKNIC